MKPYKIFAENIDPKALNQFYNAMKQDFVVKGALMPDAHLGYSLPIGAVIATEGVAVPAYVGYDIGCGMCAVPTTFNKEEVGKQAQEIYKVINEVIPVGFQHNATLASWEDYWHLPKTKVVKEIFEKQNTGFRQLGTLGGGNHFIEIGYDEADVVWIIIHSGSRNIGHKVATHYMKEASFKATGINKAKEGHYGLTGVEAAYYLTDALFCQDFALQNRTVMLSRIEEAMNGIVKGHMWLTKLINRNHNHIDVKEGLYIHRKGATHAEKGMLGVIPGNMRDGSFIVRGLGNPESLCSSSHGAGRVLGRKQAKQVLNEGDFVKQMEGIVAKVGASTLDESPGAYKDIFKVMELQKDLVEVINYIKPIINVKG